MQENCHRDLSRAQWQRAEGMVIFTELAENHYLQRLEEFSDNEIEHALTAGENGFLGGVTTTQTYMLGRRFFYKEVNLETAHDFYDKLEASVSDYTFDKTPDGVMREAATTIVHLPINIALTISAAAKNQNIKGFETDSLSDIAKILRRSDFRELISRAALTKNSVWRSYSTSRASESNEAPWMEFNFTKDNKVEFGDSTLCYLSENLREVNKNGDSASTSCEVDISSSSGCPVRHLRPHFTNTPESQQKISELADYFGKTPEEILATREKSTIDIGLDCYAEILERADSYQQKHDIGRTSLEHQVRNGLI